MFNFKGKIFVCYLKKGRLTLENITLLDIIVNGNMDLDQLIPRLEKVTDNNKVNNIQLHLSDEIFNLINISPFKEIAKKGLKHLEIDLGPKLIIVSDDERRSSRRMTMKLRSKYFWVDISKDIKNYVKKCELFQKNKAMGKVKESMVLTEIPAKAYDVLIIDTSNPFISVIRSNSGNEYAVAVAIPDKSAKPVAGAIFEIYILIYGPERNILSYMETV